MSASPRAALLLLVCSLCCGLSMARQAAAQSVESFYKGRTVTMLVGTSPGGINDISARLVARHLSRFIAGNPNIIVQNNPGGGGLVTANRLYFNSDKDGSVLAKLERAVPQLAIQGHPNAQFDPAKFTWLGSLSSYADDAYLMLVNTRHPAKTVADLKSPGIEQPDLRRDSQGGARPQRERRARLHRRGAAVSRHAARRARRPDGGLELGANRPARPLDAGRISAADGVRPHAAACRVSEHADRPRAHRRPRRAVAHRVRGAAILHGAAVRRPARRPAGSRQGAADGV